MMTPTKQIAQLVPQPWRDDLVQAGRNHDRAEIAAVRAELVRRFPQRFKPEPAQQRGVPA
jgi:hypothetical protein